jgi:hypothetical protein
MGNNNSTKSINLKKPAKLESKDIKFLSEQTGMSKQEIEEFFIKFNDNNPDGVLNKQEFVKLYCSLRPEPPERVDEIVIFIGNFLNLIFLKKIKC